MIWLNPLVLAALVLVSAPLLIHLLVQRRAARMGHEVVLFHVMSREEIEFPYARDVEFADLETGGIAAVNGREARRPYLDAVTAFLERWRSRAGAEAFQYSLVITDTPPDAALRRFLLSRREK